MSEYQYFWTRGFRWLRSLVPTRTRSADAVVPRPLSEAAAAELSTLLSEAIAAGAPLEPALRAAALEAPPQERRALEELAVALSTGQPTGEMFRRAGFPMVLAALIAAGVRTGQLGTMLGQYALVTAERREGRERLIMAVAYPGVVILICLLLIVVGIYAIMPGFIQVYEDFDTTLPALTQLLVDIARLLHNPVAVGVILLVLLVIGVPLVLWLTKGGGSRKIWPLSVFATTADWGRFCSLLPVLLEAKLPLPEALRLAASAAATGEVRQSVQTLAAEIEQGKTPAAAAASLPMPASVRQSFRWSGQLNLFQRSLLSLSRLYRQRSAFSLVTLAIFAEPVAITVVALSIGMIVIALFLPLVMLLNGLS